MMLRPVKFAHIFFTILIIIAVSFTLGAIWRHKMYFPYNILRNAKNSFMAQKIATKSVAKVEDDIKLDKPVVNKRKLSELRSISNHTNHDYIFWGDSLVEFIHDSRYYGAKNYIDIGQSGQLTYFALQEIDYVLNLKPKKVLIYLGGNDSDINNYAWYGPKTAAKHYEKIINILVQHKITPIIHQIHEAAYLRNRNYVREYNQLLADLAHKYKLKLIPNLPQLSFSQKSFSEMVEKPSPYAYEYGEHLKPAGYILWVNHIKKYISNF